MHIKNTIIWVFFLISSSVFGQIKIPDAGDGWKAKVDSAVQLIKETDTAVYRMLIENCKEVEFILAPYSTTQPPHIIAISVNDMKLNSVNNIAAVLVHESYHLFIFAHLDIENVNAEEFVCYLMEYNFLCKLTYVEDWLFKNTINKLLWYESLLNK
jgi:hypothetical protein